MFLRPGKADVQKMYLQVITSAFGHNNIFAFISWKGWKEELIMYSSEVIEEVISRNDIVDVISGYIKLKKNGSSYVGLCPFHNEKSPSFSVSGTKQMYHCFGCGVGGNVITFVMEYENYTFPEAVKMLGERAGMELPETDYSAEDRKDRDIKTRLLEINKIAATYYYHQLKSEAGKSGLDYLVKRGLSDKTINSFGLGYAPQSTGELYRMLKDKGYDDGILKESGLFTYEKGVRDKFWNRVIFPIMDINNKVIANAPKDIVINTHVCRGNFHSTYANSGAYDPVADILFGEENVDAYYLEFDDERSGGFEPLKAVSGDKKVVLGLITSKKPELEDKQTVIDRIHDAAKYISLDRLCLSPQCGFASCEIGNKLTEEEQWAKLALVKEIAEEVWG